MKHSTLLISIALLLSTAIPIASQINLVVYDGTTGIGHCHMQNDTLRVVDVIKNSPAEEAGFRTWDAILEIDSVPVSGEGLSLKEANNLLYDKSGTSVVFKMKSFLDGTIYSAAIVRVPYSDRLATSGFHYLADPDRIYGSDDILNDSFNSLFVHNTEASSIVHSVERGSRAEEIGLRAGDRLLCFEDVLDDHEPYIPEDGFVPHIIYDSILTIVREGDTLSLGKYRGTEGAYFHLKSKIRHDFNSGCIWMRFNAACNLSRNLSYLLSTSTGADTVYIYEVLNNDEIIVGLNGNSVKPEDRIYTYKSWNPVMIEFPRSGEKVFYIQLISDIGLDMPWLSFIPLKAVSEYDRLERMFLFAFLGIMLIIGFYFLILFFSGKQRSHLWYSLFLIAFGISLFIDEGYLVELSRVSQYNLYEPFEILFYILPNLIFILFGINYIELKPKLKWWYRISFVYFLFMVTVNIIIFIGNALSQYGANSLTNFLFGIYDLCPYLTYLLFVIPTILRIRKGFRPAWYFLTACVILFVSQMFYDFSWGSFSMHTFGQSSLETLLNNTGHYMGAILTFLIFTLGLAQKMRMVEKQRKLAQEKLVKQLKKNEKLKDKVNRELEEKVRKRTEKINDQKEEIESQLEEIETQRDELMDQRDMVTAQKQEITDSINYAQRIQQAVLPDNAFLDEVMPDYFVLFKPRDIVSGDFYWVREIKNFLVVVAADCTGHGVPGAFMSMLGISFLNEQIGKSRFDMPGEILDRIRKKVKQTLAQTGESQEQKDGMDMAIAIIDTESKELQFAGAFNPLYLVREGKKDKDLGKYASLEESGLQLFEIKGDRQPISVYYKETDFSTTIIQLEENDTIYMFSDGYADQMGGPRGKKYMSRTFKKSLLSIQKMPMSEQKLYLDKTLEEWRNGYEQVDDILVMGIRV